MQKIKKIVSILAAGTMLASMTAFSANATDETTIKEQVQSILDEIAAAPDEASAAAIVVARSSEPCHYPVYDSYVTDKFSPSQHYLTVIPAKGEMLTSSLKVNFYLNTNIISSMPKASDFILGYGYSGCASIGSVTNSSVSNGCRKIVVPVNISKAATIDSAVFKYSLPLCDAISSEYDFHCYTSESSLFPSSNIFTSRDNVVLQKCVYSLGDVDRDGDVDADDVQSVMSYVAGLREKPAGRSDEEAYYDEMAFRLAADFNENGIVEMSDASGINSYFRQLG